MEFISILVIAIALAMDAFAISISSGITIDKVKLKHAIKISSFFGLFQGVMPIIGWLGGLNLRDIISEIDHWIAFGLLSIIGCKMIYESIGDNKENEINPLNIQVLLILSIATSIDALAVGLSFAILDVDIIFPSIVIGIVTFLVSFFGVYLGEKFGHLFEKKAKLAGGIILIFIGIRILIEHLF